MNQLFLTPSLTRSIILVIARILFASLFFQDAIFNKIMHANQSMSLMSSIHLPFPKVLLVLIIAFELIGGCLLILGFYTQIICILFAVFCIAVSLMFHRFWQYSEFSVMQNQMNHFMKNLAIAGGAIYIAFAI